MYSIKQCMKYSIEDIYTSFRKSQAGYNSRPYKLPKDFNSFLDKRISEKNKQCLELAAKNFNTKWRHIDIDRFFTYGFELFGKNFTYTRFFDKRLVRFYIERDKVIKRSMTLTEDEINKSLMFIDSYIKEMGFNKSRLSPLSQYCQSKDGNQSMPVVHFLKGKISKYIIVFLCNIGFLVLSDDDRILLPLIVENWRNYLEELKPLNDKIIEMMKGYKFL
jgi:hypothetical protein